MRNLKLAVISLFGLSLAVGLGLGQCPEKISPKLCPAYLAAPDTAYLQVRIVLDESQEDPAFWDKSKPIRARPLRVWTEELISEFDLRQLDHAEKAYVPLYGEADSIPANDQVRYHNASVTKGHLGQLISKIYVANIELPCWRHSISLCADLNTLPDSLSLYFNIFFNRTLESDSVARQTWLSGYAVRDTAFSTPNFYGYCFGAGYVATPPTIRSMGQSPDIREIEQGGAACTLGIHPLVNPRPAPVGDFRRDALRNRRYDGRALPGTRLHSDKP